MATEKNIKLFKIASEINIGRDAIVEYLQGRGFDIQNKPTAPLTFDMVEAVYDKFKREKRAAEIQRDKIEKHKKVKKPTGDKVSVLESQDFDDDREFEEDEIKVAPKSKTETKVQPLKEKTEQKEAKKVVHETKEVKSSDELHEVQIEKEVTKLPLEAKLEQQNKEVIDLSQFDKKPRRRDDFEDQRSSKKTQRFKDGRKDRGQKQPDKNKGPEKIVVPKELIVDAMDIEIQEKPVQKEEFKTKIPAFEKSVVPEEEAINIIDQKELTISELPEETDEIAVGDEAKPKAKRRRKRKKIVEVEVEPGDTHKLKGLTIVGKIDLKFDKETEAEKKLRREKTAETDEEEIALGRKTKVKRKKGRDKLEKRKKKRVSIRELISDEDIDKALKETLSEMSESSAVSQRSKMRHRKKVEREEKEQKKLEELEIESKILKITEYVTTAALADLMKANPSEIIIKCMGLGLMVTLNQRLDKDTITLIADDYGFEVEFLDEKAAQLIDESDSDEDPATMEPRPPIVTVMGHVDHGKTSLLDFIRKTRVVAGEAGGITQHIGAYRVIINEEKSITFLDTPGHEAFTAMRARGAQVTDIVVLVVAADDSVMPQTIEAISHAQAANVPILVAINKIDKPDANPDRIRQQLADQNILVEDWGGKYQCVEISAKKGINVDTLLEKILLEAEMLDLKANPNRNARGTVVEANMDKGFGAVATVIIQKGRIRVGDPFVAGVAFGKVRAMFDERGNKVEVAGPSIPIRAIGFDVLPEAGDILIGADSELESRAIANERQRLKREQEFRQVRLMTLDDISRQIQIGGVKDLFLIIKGDVSGSVEALSDSLQKQSTEEVRVVILHKGVGSITESDVMLAIASKAVIIGFQVSPTGNARKLAEKESVDIRLYNIIYDAINEVRLALEGLLTPELREDIIGSVEVRKVFKISKLGYIAGCIVKEGKIRRNDRVRLLRDGLPVYNGTLHSLKRNKDDVKEVDTNYECGIMLEGFNDVEVGDVVQVYKLLEIKRTL